MTWPPGQPSVAADALHAAFNGKDGWTLVLERFCLRVYVRGTAAPAVTLLPKGGVLIGQMFDRAATEAGAVAAYDLHRLGDEDGLTVARRVVDEAWGRYVLVLPVKERRPIVLREPLGALDALIWRKGDAWCIADDVPPVLAPDGLAIDETRLAHLIAEPDLASAEVPLTGVTAVLPGTVVDEIGSVHRLWAPARFARAPRVDASTASERIPLISRACIAALAKGHESILCEISGGLDSAIVATSLKAEGGNLGAAINFHWPQAEADERPYARAVAKAVRTRLEVIASRVAPVAPDAFDAAVVARPSFNAVDPVYDAVLAQRLVQGGESALFTGQGGDAVFYQMPAPQLSLDLLVRGPRRRGLMALSRRTNRSVWSLLRVGARAPVRATFPYGARHVGRAPKHPWLQELRGVGAAKRIQIEALVANQAVFAASRRGAVADLVHPLLSQPLVELCLSTPAAVLAGGEQDRAFVRSAFRAQLPRLVLDRQSKGDLSVFFAKGVAKSLPDLRPRLLEGRLAARGLIDVAALSEAMQPEAMIWRDGSAEILCLAVLESWVRTWEARGA